MDLAPVVHRVATDGMFAARLLADPDAALASLGLPVDDEGITEFVAVLRDHPSWQILCSPDTALAATGPWYS